MHTYQGLSVLDALGDPTRRAVFEQLRDGPLAVGELARRLPVTRPAVSQHLRVLKAAGLVQGEAHGARRLYRIDPAGLADLRAYVERFWGDALERFRQVAEERTAEEAEARIHDRIHDRTHDPAGPAHGGPR